MSIHSWSSPQFVFSRHIPQTLSLSNEEVHVWRASVELEAADLNSLQQTLTADEQRRAEQFHFSKDRERFIAARGLLRIILSCYLDIEPSYLRFCYSTNGKPSLVQAQGRDIIQFNLSHSRGLALYAITRNRQIGIDLEYMRADFAWEEIAARFFSPRERAMLRQLPTEARHKAFFNCWTRKEAYVKATGKGLSIPLDQFDVSLAPGEPAVLLSTQWNPQEAERWSLQELIPAPDYIAALAVEGDRWQLRCWQWSAECSKL